MSVKPSGVSKTVNLGYGDYIRFRELILNYSGLHFPDKKQIDLELGINKALADSPLPTKNGEINLDDYYHLLTRPEGRAEMERLINALTVGETYFFRDEAQFDALATHVLPQLIQKKRAAAAAVGPGVRPQLRIWSAGCATGEEPYSIAMLLRELLPDIDNWYILILATDINQNALQRARQGIYSNWSFREARAKMLRPRYFRDVPPADSRSTSSRYKLGSNIRQMVTFAPLNLIADSFPAIDNNTVSMDLILCRNVTIYFTEAITRRIVQQFYRALVDGGWLVVGHSEPSIFVYRDFQAKNFPNTLLYQKTGRSNGWPQDWPQPDGAATGPALARSLPSAAPSLPKQAKNGKIAAQPSGVFQSSTPPLEPDEICQRARQKLDHGQPEQARQLLQELLAEQPNYPPAHTLLALIHANQGHWAEAHRCCQRAIKLDSLQIEAHRILSLVHESQGDFQAAISALKKVIYLERRGPLDHFHLAMLYRRNEQWEQAKLALQNTIKILKKWSPEALVPDTGGTTAGHLLQTAQSMLQKL